MDKNEELDELIHKMKRLICDGENILSAIETACSYEVNIQQDENQDFTIVYDCIKKFNVHNVFDDFILKYGYFNVTINGHKTKIYTELSFKKLLIDILKKAVTEGRYKNDTVVYENMNIMVVFNPLYKGYKEDLKLYYIPYKAEA